MFRLLVLSSYTRCHPLEEVFIIFTILLVADVQLGIVFNPFGEDLLVAVATSFMECLACFSKVIVAVCFNVVEEQTLRSVTMVTAADLVLSLGHGFH